MIYIFSNVPENQHISPEKGDILIFLNKASNFEHYRSFPGRKILFRRMEKETYGDAIPEAENWLVFGEGLNTIPGAFLEKLRAEYDWNYSIGEGDTKSMTTGYMVAMYIRDRFRNEKISLVNFGYEVKESTYRCTWHNWRHEAEKLKEFPHIYTAQKAERKEGKPPRILYELNGWLGDKVIASAVLANAAAAGIKVNVDTNSPEMWTECPFLDRGITRENADHIIRPGYSVAWAKNAPHVIDSVTKNLSDNIDYDIPHRTPRPFIFGKVPAGRLIQGKYVLVNTGWQNSAPTKKWHYRLWKELIASLPDVTFVQFGQTRNHAKAIDLPNVRNMIDKTNTLQFFQLVRDAACVISPPSACIHIAGAYSRPAIILAGGREPGQMTRYEGMEAIDIVGRFPCCQKGGCHRNRFELGGGEGCCINFHVQDGEPVGGCMGKISPAMVADKLKAILG